MKPLESFLRLQTYVSNRRGRAKGVTSVVFHSPETKQAGPGLCQRNYPLPFFVIPQICNSQMGILESTSLR